MLWNQCTCEWLWFGEPCHIFPIPSKGLKSTTFNIKNSWNFTHA
jgi:hypothetical protein